MELVYTVAKSHRCKRRDFEFRDEKPLISLSARNSLALCTTATLTEDKAEQYVVVFIRHYKSTRLLAVWVRLKFNRYHNSIIVRVSRVRV